MALHLTRLFGEVIRSRAGYSSDAVHPRATDPSKLRELASWYRDFAKSASSPCFQETRLRTAQDLEAEADQIQRMRGSKG
jgi:hypothetical protein